MYRSISLALIVLIFSPNICLSDDNLDEYFTAVQAKEALESLSHESFKFQLLAGKIKVHPKYSKFRKLPKDYEIYIRVGGTEINSLGDIDAESFYLKPAHDRVYIERYMQYMEYKIKKLELELAKVRNLPQQRISSLTTEVESLEKKLQSYMGPDMWPD